MNKEMIQTIYSYHYQRFGEVWDSIMLLDEAQFFQDVPYATGSLHKHMVHLIDDDLSWITLLAGTEHHMPLHPGDFATRADVRAKYDSVEAYVLRFVRDMDEAIVHKEFVWSPQALPEPQYVLGWQVLLHVVNHGTDHRAQLLRLLHDLGAPSFDQDLMGFLVKTGKTSR